MPLSQSEIVTEWPTTNNFKTTSLARAYFAQLLIASF